jgi:hypothetical protein
MLEAGGVMPNADVNPHSYTPYHMTTPESHSVRNGVIATIVGGIALAGLGELWLPAKLALVWSWDQVASFVGLFGAAYQVPGWLLAAISVLALVTVVRSLVGLRTVASPQHFQFVEDQLYGAKWRWSWSGGDVSNLWCFCSRCDSELVYDDSTARSIYSHEGARTHFICEHCSRETVASIPGGDKDYALGVVRREIRRKVRLGLYAKAAVNVG